MSDPTALITKLEAATEGSRLLDAYIWMISDNRELRLDGDVLLAKSRKQPYDECVLGVYRHHVFDAELSHKPPLPRYTTSLDAALTLVPEGWQVHMISNQPRWTVVVRSPDARYEEAEFPSQGGTYEHWLVAGKDASGIQKPAALAVCIAALRARAAVESEPV